MSYHDLNIYDEKDDEIIKQQHDILVEKFKTDSVLDSCGFITKEGYYIDISDDIHDHIMIDEWFSRNYNQDAKNLLYILIGNYSWIRYRKFNKNIYAQLPIEHISSAQKDALERQIDSITNYDAKIAFSRLNHGEDFYLSAFISEGSKNILQKIESLYSENQYHIKLLTFH